MKVLIVHAHAEPKSFNASLTQHAVSVLRAEGHEVQISDLYAMCWNPVSDRRNFVTEAEPDYYRQQVEEVYAHERNGFADDVQGEMDKLVWCDALIAQFPLWWFGMPGILKGWFDRVLAMGFAYGRGRWYDRGVFRGKRAMLSLTTGSPSTAYTEAGIHGAMDALMFPVNHGILSFTGFEVLPQFVAYGVNHHTEEERAAMLAEYGERVKRLWTDEPIRYPSVEDFEPGTLLLKSVISKAAQS